MQALTFWDSTGNTGGGYGAASASAFMLFDGNNNSLQWVMSAQPANNLQILKAGNWSYPGGRYANSHASSNLDPSYADLVVTWQGTTYWAYFDGAPVAYGSFADAYPSAGLFSQIAIGAAVGGSNGFGQPLGPYSILRFQLSTAFNPPPALGGTPLVAFYGDSFVVQGGGVTGDVPNLSGSPTIAQVNAVQAQLDPTTSPGASSGTNGQDGFISLANAYALKHYGGYARFYTAAKSGHGWAYDGMGGTTAQNTPAIDDFNLGKTGFSDALNAAQPDYIFGFGSVNDVNNGVPTDLVGNVKAHFDYWADHNPNLKGIYYVETLSWELATGACTARGGPAGWKAEMTRQRELLRAAFTGGTAAVTPNAYLAGTRKVPVTYIPSYETWVQGANSARFLIASNPDNHTQSSNTGSSPNGHPDAEGNVQMVDAYVWPYLSPLLSAPQLVLSGTGSENDSGLLSYALTVSAEGSQAAQGVVVTKVLASGETFVAGSSSPACSLSGQTISCAIGSIAAGASASLQIVIQLATATAGPVSETFSIGSSNGSAGTTAYTFIAQSPGYDSPVLPPWAALLTGLLLLGQALRHRHAPKPGILRHR